MSQNKHGLECVCLLSLRFPVNAKEQGLHFEIFVRPGAPGRLSDGWARSLVGSGGVIFCV